MAEFVPNPTFEVEMLRSPELALMLKAKIGGIVEEAKSIAPVGDDRDPHPGEFRDSIEGSVGMLEGRLVARLSSDDPAAAYIIHGTNDTPPHDTFFRAIETKAVI